MNTIKRSEQGFGTVEGIAVVIIVVLIGVGGWLIYKNHHQATKPATTTKPAATTTRNTTIDQTVVKVPELGIELVNLPSSIKDLTYKIFSPNANQTYTIAEFTTASLVKLDATCTSIGNLNRYSGTYDANTDQGPSTFVKQFNGFWIAFVHNGVECSQDPTTLNLQTSQMQTFKDWVVTPANLQAAQ